MRPALRVIYDLGLTLTSTYPYAYRVGARVLSSSPEWEQQWQSVEPQLAELQLSQARAFAFLRWLESRAATDPQTRSQLLTQIDAALQLSSPTELSELRNTAEWYLQRAAERARSGVE